MQPPAFRRSLSATRTWQAVDACGNASSCQQTVTVFLSPPPVITSPLAGQTVAYGSNVTLTVTATGAGPLTYQWRCFGTNMPGATGSSLTLSSVAFTNAGCYSVAVGNPAGQVVTPEAVINVAPMISCVQTGKSLTLRLPGPYILQASLSPLGPYTDVPLAVSPF